MMVKSIMEPGEGERLLAARRRRFWTIIAVMVASGALVGFFSGMYAGYTDAQREKGGIAALEPSDFPVLLRFAAVLVAVLAFAALTWWFVRSVDELEIADNLWASTTGLYAYSIAFPAWWALWKLEVTREPDDWTIYAATLVITGLVYLWRKWQAR